MNLDKSKYKIIILGTSFTNSILSASLSYDLGNEMLHLDEKNEYGDDLLTLRLDEYNQWITNLSTNKFDGYSDGIVLQPLTDEQYINSQNNRKFALDTNPQFILSNSYFIDILVNSNCYNYLEFHAVDYNYHIESVVAEELPEEPAEELAEEEEEEEGKKMELSQKQKKKKEKGPKEDGQKKKKKISKKIYTNSFK